MHLDVVDLRAFYYRTKLGRSVQRVLQEAMLRLWPDTEGLVLAGYGFAAPVLRPFLGKSAKVLNLMPGPQGVMPWPMGEPNLSVMVEETLWPLEAGSVDRMIVAHGLETCTRADELLEEIYRVLSPGGLVAFIVPNRSGIWARRDATPFGYGRPYSSSQVEALLKRHKFLPERHAAALYSPPSHRNYWLKSARMLERMGRGLDWQMLAGVLIVEATKQVYATPRRGNPVAVPGPLEVLEGLTRPKPKPVVGRASRGSG